MSVSNLNVLNYLPQNPNKLFYSKEDDNPLELFSNDIGQDEDDVIDSYYSQTSYNENKPINFQSDIDELKQHKSIVIQEFTHDNILKINSFKEQNDNCFDLYNQQSLFNSSKKCHKFGLRCKKLAKQRRNNKNVATKEFN